MQAMTALAEMMARAWRASGTSSLLLDSTTAVPLSTSQTEGGGGHALGGGGGRGEASWKETPQVLPRMQSVLC
jgi:hypothetical protein